MATWSVVLTRATAGPRIVRRTEKGWLVNQTARRLVEDVQADWARSIGPDKMDALVALLGELVDALGFKYSPRIGGVGDGRDSRPGLMHAGPAGENDTVAGIVDGTFAIATRRSVSKNASPAMKAGARPAAVC